MKINVVGRVQLYEPSGSYSIIIEKAEPDGIGALAIQFEQLKKKLAEAGYLMSDISVNYHNLLRKLVLLPVQAERSFVILSRPFHDVFQGLKFFFSNKSSR